MRARRRDGPASYPASRAEKIAAGLIRACGPQALDRARQRGRRAEAAGHHGQVDLYTAVCMIIADPGGVFSRSRAPVAPAIVVGLRPLSEGIGARPRLPLTDYPPAIVIKAA